MSNDASNFVSPETLAYCNAARRVRARVTDSAAKLQQLQQLAVTARRSDPGSGLTKVEVTAKAQADSVCPAVLLGVGPDREIAVRRFVDHVRATLGGVPVMTGRQRLQLLRVATGMSVERFHANLVIAAMMHECEASAASAASVEEAEKTVESSNPLRIVAAILVTQSVVLLLLGYVWSRLFA